MWKVKCRRRSGEAHVDLATGRKFLFIGGMVGGGKKKKTLGVKQRKGDNKLEKSGGQSNTYISLSDGSVPPIAVPFSTNLPVP